MIKSYHPQIKVTVEKNIQHSKESKVSGRMDPPKSEVDLTPFLGEGSGVLTNKSVYQPMGMFTITIPDRQNESTMDTLYASLEPMDQVTIRMSHTPGQLPVVMRGFIRAIRRAEVMGQDGRPQRQVVIIGNDYGVIFNNARFYWFLRYLVGKTVVPNFSLYFTFFKDDKKNAWPVTQFFTELLEKVINPYLQEIFLNSPRTEGGPTQISAEFQDVPGWVTVPMMQAHDGAVWELMERLMDAPWNECFVLDRESGPVLVFRPTPFKNLDGAFIQGSTGETSIGNEDIVTMDASRAHDNVVNFLQVASSYAPLCGMHEATPQFHKESNNAAFTDYENARSGTYGQRMLNAHTMLAPLTQAHPNGHKEEVIKANEAEMGDWIKERIRVLKELNKDNVVFEQGILHLRGNEKVIPGDYIKVRRGTLNFEVYAAGVSHHYRPFHSYTTTANFIRGTSFWERMKAQQGPYFSERT